MINENNYRGVMKGHKDRLISTQELLQTAGSHESLIMGRNYGFIRILVTSIPVEAVAEVTIKIWRVKRKQKTSQSSSSTKGFA